VAVVLSFALGAAQADWFDNFDGYLPGSINGQGGWSGWDNTPAAAGEVSSAQSLSPTQSQANFGGHDSVREYAGYTAGQWVYSAWTYLPTGATGVPYFIMLNRYVVDDGVPPGEPKAWSIQIPMDLGTDLLNDDMAAGDENIPLIRNQWVKLQLDIDLDNNTVDTYYGATFVSTHRWYDPGDVNAHAAIEAVDLWANSADRIYYDDMSLTPEPASLALLALALVLRRR
jgi:hypothetical protein